MSPKKHSDQFSRREFLHLLSTLGGAAAFTAFLQACSQAGLDPTQALIPTSMPTRFSPTDTLFFGQIYHPHLTFCKNSALFSH